MLKIGLTGGIGSGKTTVAKIFETLDIPVYYADDAAKRIMNENAALRAEIQKHFGQDTYSNNQLNRAVLASQVFGNKEKLSLLNSLVHPLTIADAEAWMNLQTSPYAIKEAALVFESDVYKGLDDVIGVSAPYELRMQRAMQRDGITKEAVQARMDKQMNEEEKMNRCDFIIYNDEQHLLIPQVLQLHEQLITLSAKQNA
ncbi:MAG: dephospho-CoA kinase [Chitinophagaceae bacterium]|nr:MAG: dephospho-CoA kinase [Chitinophagaceae bacterium]